MANNEHVEYLMKGSAYWNSWRRSNPDVQPDLSRAILNAIDLSGANLDGADLSEAILSKANLVDTDFSRANLSGADFRGSNLGEANLSDTNLSGADLSDTDLSDTNLSGADLRGANLRRRHLSGTNFQRANLDRTNFRGARLFRVNFRGANLRRAILDETEIAETDFFGAKLNQASFFNTSIIQSDLTGVDIDFDYINLELGSKIQFPILTIEIALTDQYVGQNNVEVLEKSIDFLMQQVGFILKRCYCENFQYLWKHFEFIRKNSISIKESEKNLREMKTTFSNVLSSKSQDSKTNQFIEPVTQLIKSLELFDNGVLRLGHVLIVKTAQNDEHNLLVVEVSHDLATALANNPPLMTDPERLSAEIQRINPPQISAKVTNGSTCR